jgi:flagellar basal-body rod modification protein FlgD
MNINALITGAAAHAATSDGSGTSSAQSSNDMFMQLLVAQLKGQSPLDPVDPTQFVGQLVQFNTLDQIIQIREAVQQLSSSGSTSSTATGHNQPA